MTTRRKRPTALFLTAVVLVAGGTAGLSTVAMATAVRQDEASITFTDQVSGGTQVGVSSVVLPDGGFVAVEGSDGTIAGVSEYLTAGEHADVTVTLDEPLTEGGELVAVAHRDTNSNREFDFRDGELGGLVDFAYGVEDAGAVVSDTAQVTVRGVADGDDETATETTAVETPETTETPTEVPVETTPEATTETPTVTTREGDGEQAPFDGSAATVPGRIQVEEFDEGGSGVAYSDSDESNAGGEFRPSEGVDIEATDDTGGGYNVGWTTDGEWLEYTVDVTDGTYDVSARVAAPADADEQALRFELNGTTLGTLDVPQTGGYQEWQTVTLEDVPVSGDGTEVLRVEIVGGDYNVNWIEFSENGTDGAAGRTDVAPGSRRVSR